MRLQDLRSCVRRRVVLPVRSGALAYAFDLPDQADVQRVCCDSFAKRSQTRRHVSNEIAANPLAQNLILPPISSVSADDPLD
jgi:hypothetical protein